MVDFKFALSREAPDAAKTRVKDELSKLFPGHTFEHVDYKTFHLPDNRIMQISGTIHTFGPEMVATGDYDEAKLSSDVTEAFNKLKDWKPS